MDTFTRESLERYFKHHKFTSFQRQLNLYGFRKIAKGERCGYYVHPHFQRDHPEWLSKVRRTPQPGKSTPRSNSAPAPTVAKSPKKANAPAAAATATATSAKATVKKEKEEDYSIARTMSNLISHAVGFLDGMGSEGEGDAKDMDEQGNPLRRSKRRQARRLREHEFQLMQMQQRQQEMEGEEDDDVDDELDVDAEAELDDQSFEEGDEPMKLPEPVSEQPGMDEGGSFFSPASFHPATPKASGRAKLRRISTDEAFLSAIESVCDFEELDHMDLAADPSNAGMFADSALEIDMSTVKTEQPTLQHDNVGDFQGRELRSGMLSGDIDDLWDEDMHIGQDMVDVHEDSSFLSFGDVMCL